MIVRIQIEGTNFTYGQRLLELPMRVRHADLESFGGGSFKRHCPVCKFGVLLVSRNLTTCKIQRRDTCTACGQRYLYMDLQINGEEFHAEV